MPKPLDLPPGTEWIDLTEADRTLLRYKRGSITREDARTILLRDCCIPELALMNLFAETDATPLEHLEMRAAGNGTASP